MSRANPVLPTTPELVQRNPIRTSATGVRSSPAWAIQTNLLKRRSPMAVRSRFDLSSLFAPWVPVITSFRSDELRVTELRANYSMTWPPGGRTRSARARSRSRTITSAISSSEAIIHR
jgi:hypothetical protein